MPAAPQSSVQDSRAIRYDSEAFSRLAASAEERAGEGLQIIFQGAPPEKVQEALAAFAENSTLSIHQIDLSSLVQERDDQTRGNVREAFDSAGEDGTILFFNHADEFFSQIEEEAARGGEDKDARTPIDYLFQRTDAFKGIVILALSDPAHVARARQGGIDVVVTF